MGGADRLRRRPAHRPEILQTTADGYRKLRNTLRYLLGALDGFDGAESVEPAAMPPLERCMLHRLAELDGEVRAAYEGFDFQDVFQALFQFCDLDLSAFFFDIRKDALYCDAATDPRRRAARTVMDAVFERLVTWLAPMLPFTMEEAWLARFPGEDSSVHLVDFPATPADWHDAALAARWEGIRRARRVVTGALEIERREKRIGASLEAAPEVFVADEALRAALAKVDFQDVCITSALALSAGAAPAGAFTLEDVPGHRRGAAAGGRLEMRPLLEDPSGRRHPPPPRRLLALRRRPRLRKGRVSAPSPPLSPRDDPRGASLDTLKCG